MGCCHDYAQKVYTEMNNNKCNHETCTSDGFKSECVECGHMFNTLEYSYENAKNGRRRYKRILGEHKKKVSDLQSAIDEMLGDSDGIHIDTDCDFEYDEILKEEYPLVWIHKELVRINKQQ